MTTTSDSVKQQYEAFPYPPPASISGSGELATGSPSHVLEIDHFIYGGQRDWSQPFRALVAGGGIGNAAIMLAQQLTDIGCPAEVVYTDLSTASRKVAEARARERSLTNITFHTGSLLDIGTISPEPFDYIDCCGVLHHLPDPDAGLHALAVNLKDDGGLGLMLYGPYGRTGVYEIQSIMRDLAQGQNQTEQLPILKSLLKALPESNRLVRNTALSHAADLADEELVDRYLHPQDRAYTVPEIGDFLEAANLRLASFLPVGRYDPKTYISDPSLCDRWADADILTRASLAERLAGNIGRHNFYAVKTGNTQTTVAQPRTQLMTPVMKKPVPPETIAQIGDHTVFYADFNGLRLEIPAGPLAKEILQRIDGRRTLGDIFFDIRTEIPTLDWLGFLGAFQALYGTFHGLLNVMFLRQTKP